MNIELITGLLSHSSPVSIYAAAVALLAAVGVIIVTLRTP